MYIYISYILLIVSIIWLINHQKEGYFTFYQGMPGIPKTYISPHFILNQGCEQNARAVLL